MEYAHRAGISTVVLPERNRKDEPDIPEEILRELKLIYVQRMEEAVASALETLRDSAEARPQ